MAKVLVVGCGNLGSGLAKELVSAGHIVTAIRRTGTEFPDKVTGITGDVLTLKNEHLPDADMIFLIMTPRTRSEEDYQQAYLFTAQRLIDRYHASTVQPKIFFVSSTSVYGQNNGELLTEQQPALPNSATAKVLLAVEIGLSERLPTTSIRFSGIYGGNRLRLIEQAQQQEEWPANRWTNRIHRDDCIRVLAFLANAHHQGQTLESIYIATDSVPVSLWEVKLWIATSLGVASNLPINESASAFIPISGKRLSNQRLCKLGFRFLYSSYSMGYAESLMRYVPCKEK